LKKISWRLVIVIGVIIAAFVYVLPTFTPALWPHKKINLGLDLQGGMHLVLEVDTEKAVEGTVERIAQELKDQIKKERIRHTSIDRIEGTKISVIIRDPDNVDDVDKLLDKDFKDLRILSRSKEGENLVITMDLPDNRTDQIKKMATDQALETIRNRIDQFGVSEPDIRRQGEKRLLIQLPGIKDTKKSQGPYRTNGPVGIQTR